jgi:hypothetical protein
MIMPHGGRAQRREAEIGELREVKGANGGFDLLRERFVVVAGQADRRAEGDADASRPAIASRRGARR